MSCVWVFQSERAIVKERELSLELARIRDEVGKWDRHTAPSGVEKAMSHSLTLCPTHRGSYSTLPQGMSPGKPLPALRPATFYAI